MPCADLSSISARSTEAPSQASRAVRAKLTPYVRCLRACVETNVQYVDSVRLPRPGHSLRYLLLLYFSGGQDVLEFGLSQRRPAYIECQPTQQPNHRAPHITASACSRATWASDDVIAIERSYNEHEYEITRSSSDSAAARECSQQQKLQRRRCCNHIKGTGRTGAACAAVLYVLPFSINLI